MSGKPWPRLTAPVRTASADISEKIVGGDGAQPRGDRSRRRGRHARETRRAPTYTRRMTSEPAAAPRRRGRILRHRPADGAGRGGACWGGSAGRCTAPTGSRPASTPSSSSASRGPGSRATTPSRRPRATSRPSSASRASARTTSSRCSRVSRTTRSRPASGTSRARRRRAAGQLRAGRASRHPRRAAAADARPRAGRQGHRRDPAVDLHLRPRHRRRRPVVPFTQTWVINPLPDQPRPGRRTAGAGGRSAADHPDDVLGALPHRQPDDRVRAPAHEGAADDLSRSRRRVQ